MNIEEFLNQYDIQEGDLLECENGEVYEYSAPYFYGPKPRHFCCRPDYIAITPKRLWRPDWQIAATSWNCETSITNKCWFNCILLQPKQPKKPTITVNVPKGVDVKVVENE